VGVVAIEIAVNVVDVVDVVVVVVDFVVACALIKRRRQVLSVEAARIRVECQMQSKCKTCTQICLLHLHICSDLWRSICVLLEKIGTSRPKR